MILALNGLLFLTAALIFRRVLKKYREAWLEETEKRTTAERTLFLTTMEAARLSTTLHALVSTINVNPENMHIDCPCASCVSSRREAEQREAVKEAQRAARREAAERRNDT